MSLIYGKGIYIMGEPQPVKVSLTPKPGVDYTDGFQMVDPNLISIISEAISNNTAITADTT